MGTSSVVDSQLGASIIYGTRRRQCEALTVGRTPGRCILWAEAGMRVCKQHRRLLREGRGLAFAGEPPAETALRAALCAAALDWALAAGVSEAGRKRLLADLLSARSAG